MTIYSQHPNRGKVQILATYNGTNGLKSTTVTSVETADLAAPIVDALNRASACATVPLSVWNDREGSSARYPREHLAALMDRARRDDLLTGAHSLWYEYVKLVLHEALVDLDEALGSVPAPVRSAVESELTTEASQLQAALAEYRGEPVGGVTVERLWDFHHPIVLFDGGIHELRDFTRERMNDAEDDDFDRSLEQTVDNLRILFEATLATSSQSTRLDDTGLSIFDEPDFCGYFLSIDPPRPRYSRHSWEISIQKWVPESEDPDEEFPNERNEEVLTCALPIPPTASEISTLLNMLGTDGAQLIAWSKTQVGNHLAGTPYVVTERHDAG